MSLILDPTNERIPVKRSITKRKSNLSGRLALLDIRKPRGNVLLDRLEEVLSERCPDISISRYSKPTFTKPAPDELRREIRSQAYLVVEALADGGSCTTCSLHDTVWFEIQGVSAVSIASTEFQDAAATQAKALGMDDAQCVFVPHPIQDATDEEMRRTANECAEFVIKALTDENGSTDSA